jgi:hypothetical protein
MQYTYLEGTTQTVILTTVKTKRTVVHVATLSISLPNRMGNLENFTMCTRERAYRTGKGYFDTTICRAGSTNLSQLKR